MSVTTKKELRFVCAYSPLDIENFINELSFEVEVFNVMVNGNQKLIFYIVVPIGVEPPVSCDLDFPPE